MVTIDIDELFAYGDDECRQLANDALSLKARCDRVLKNRREQRIEVLTAEHQSLVAELQKEEALEQRLGVEQGELLTARNSVDPAVIESLRSMAALRGEAPDPAYSLKADLEAHSRAVEQAEQKHARVVERQTAYNKRVRNWRTRVMANKERLETLRVQIDEKWSAILRLQGHKVRRVDPSTGLQLSA
jgi:hypothetical protein